MGTNITKKIKTDFFVCGYLTSPDLAHGDFLVKYFAFVEMFISAFLCFSEWLFFDAFL